MASGIAIRIYSKPNASKASRSEALLALGLVILRKLGAPSSGKKPRRNDKSPVITQPMNQKRAIGRKLAVISRQLWLRFDQRVQSSGLTRAKWSLIAAVAVNPGATQRLIAAKLEVTEVTAGRLIDRLCVDGLLERRENPNDRRGYCVYLTPAAQPLLQTMGEIAKTHEDEAFAGIDDKDLLLLDMLLDTIARNVAAASQGRYEARKSLEMQAETTAQSRGDKACPAKSRRAVAAGRPGG